ncbi:Protein tesmin/TSO1-like CXC 6, partial [Mucuna pruriens]
MGEGEGGDCAPKNASLSEVVAPAVALEVPPKKLARQLDFTGAPEHAQQPQSQPLAVLPLPPQVLHASVRVGKPESPKSRSRPNFEMKDATPKKQKQCNCKHSKCLKLMARAWKNEAHENHK